VVTASARAATPSELGTAATLKRDWVGFGAMAAVFLVAPFVLYPVFLMKALLFGLFACAFNLLIGYAGLLSFGHAAYLGAGGYASAHAAKVWGFPPELAIAFGAALAAALGLVIGALAIRRQGIYFAMTTLALAQMVYFFCLQVPFTGGEDGIQAVPRGVLLGVLPLDDTMTLYFVVLAIFLGGFLLIHRTIRSPFGQVLKSIRDNEPRAVSLGYKADRYKLIAFVLSAALTGVAGATKAFVFQLASLTDVHWSMSGEVVLMTLLGGLGTVYGPVAGAFVVVALENYLSQLGAWVTVVQGAIFVVCVLTFRRGIVGELSHRTWNRLRLNVVVTVAPAAPEGTVKVGIVSSVTGPLALLGRAGIEGARLAVAELNAAGGVLGHKVDLLVRDDTGKPDAGVREGREAIVDDEVALLLGPVSSAVLLPMSELAREHRTILISHTANSERVFVERGHRYVFSVVPNTFMEGGAVAQYLAAKPYRRYMVLGPDYELGHIEADAFERRLRELRGDAEIAGRVWPKLGETDFSAHVAAIIGVRPDAVYSNLFGTDLVEFTRQARAADLFGEVAFVGLYDVEALQALGKDAVEGVVGYERGPFHVIRALAPSERFEDFIRRYGAATNRFPSTWAINAYDAVMAWARATARAGVFDTERIVDALEGMELDSLRGPGRFIRKVDHQVNAGTYIGVVAWDERFPDFALWKDATYIPGEQVWRPEAEVARVRATATL
jgi:branched-chain amino acid transport system permease protein